VRHTIGSAIVGMLTIMPDGIRLPVREGETMLDTCRRYGYSLRVGCREGGCGDCALQLISGEAKYDLPIAESSLATKDREAGVCLPCRAIPMTDASIKLNRSDTLGKGPFADRLVQLDLKRLGLQDKGSTPTRGPAVAGAATHEPARRRSLKVSRPSMSTGTAMISNDTVTDFHEFDAQLVIDQKEAVAEGVATLTLADPSGKDLPEWSPGAHIDVVLDNEELTRQYSLCGSTKDRQTWRIGVLHDPNSRGGSRFIHEQLATGTALRVRGPRNHFPLIDSPGYVFIAGGIGITPVIPMIAYAEGIGANWTLIYGGRQRSSMAFLDELASYGDRVRVFPQEDVGFIPLTDPSILGDVKKDTLIYCCGPEPLLQAVESASAHWPPGSLHIERFAAKVVPADPKSLDSFEVVCQRSGSTLKVEPDKSILTAAEEAGLKVLASCRAGVCGTCEVDVIEGVPDHRDSVLSSAEREENEFMLVCISRSKTPRLVLDL
jgi:ferredoxin-NADP reductase